MPEALPAHGECPRPVPSGPSRMLGYFRSALQALAIGNRKSCDVEMTMLPQRTRQALRDHAGQLSAEELRSLSFHADWAPYAWVLGLKLLQHDTSSRDVLFQEYVRRAAEGGALTSMPLPGDGTVKASKLFQVNRMGPKTFRGALESLCDRVCETGAPCIVAHTTLIAVRNLCAPSRKPFLVAYPEAKDGVVGHVVDPRKERTLVTPVERDTDVRELLETDGITLVDDTATSGDTLADLTRRLQERPRWPRVAGERTLVDLRAKPLTETRS